MSVYLCKCVCVQGCVPVCLWCIIVCMECVFIFVCVYWVCVYMYVCVTVEFTCMHLCVFVWVCVHTQPLGWHSGHLLGAGGFLGLESAGTRHSPWLQGLCSLHSWVTFPHVAWTQHNPQPCHSRVELSHRTFCNDGHVLPRGSGSHSLPWKLSTWDVASELEELKFWFYLIWIYMEAAACG